MSMAKVVKAAVTKVAVDIAQLVAILLYHWVFLAQAYPPVVV